jgi:hypothetical protein
MNFFSIRRLTGEEREELIRCIRCGDRPNIVQIMLDPRKRQNPSHVRMPVR